MIVADRISEYTVLDAGEGMKLENWGGYILARPDPQVIWEKSRPQLWETAHAVYHRSSTGGGRWEYKKPLPERWEIGYEGLRFYVRPTGFKHTGLFPEQSANWQFMMDVLSGGEEVLNLFAYTGGATMAAAKAGARLTHVDAARSMVAWAKENAALCGLEKAPIRYLVDDCMKFVLREQRRGRKYDGIIMDPPSYGRGSGGQVWRAEDNLFSLVKECAKLLSDTPKFFIINSYTTGLAPSVLGYLLHLLVAEKYGGTVSWDELGLPVTATGMALPCGATGRWFSE